MFKKLLSRDNTFPKIKVKTREEMFTLFAERAAKLDLVKSKDSFFAALKERESQGSTEVAPGIAMPHAKDDSIKTPFVMIATSKKGIKYHGFSKVNLVFCLAAPKDDPVYLNLMVKTARLLKKQDFVDLITKSDVPEDILNAIVSYEERLEVPADKGREDMFLVLLTLNNDEDAGIAEPLFLELGIRNTCIFDGKNLLDKIQTEIPLFAAVGMGKRSNTAKTFIGISEDAEIAPKLNSLLKQEGIDIWQPGKGVLSSIKLESVFGGINPEINF